MRNTISDFILKINEGAFLVHNIENEGNDDGITILEEIYFSSIVANVDKHSVLITLDKDREYRITEDEICDVSEVMGDLVITLDDFRLITITS